MFNLYGKLYVGGDGKARAKAAFSSPMMANASIGKSPRYDTPLSGYKVIAVGDKPVLAELPEAKAYSEHGYWPGIISDNLNTDARTMLLVSEDTYAEIKKEAYESAKALVGYKGFDNTLLVDCDPNKLPLELVVEFINDGIDPVLFKDKASKMLKNSIMYRTNSDMGQLKAMLFHRPEIVGYIAEALGLKIRTIALPQVFLDQPLLLKACRGWMAVDDFPTESSFEEYVRTIARIKLDSATAGFFEDDNARTAVVAEESLTLLHQDDVAKVVFNNLHIFKSYLLSKGDRFNLETLTDKTNAIFSHPQWWSNKAEGENVLSTN